MEFSSTLDILLEDAQQASEAVVRAENILKKLEAARREISNLQHHLQVLQNKITADLAVAIHRKMPALNVGLDKNGNCKIGYKTKHLVLRPDIERGMWEVMSTDQRFASRFIKGRRRTLFINNDLNPVIDAIASFFTDHYKSIGENIIGHGKIIIDDKLCTLSTLLSHRETCELPPLASRSLN